MSDSYKKENGSTISGKSAKDGKSSYNAQNRKKTRQVLKEIEKSNGTDVEPAEKLVDGGIDYTLPDGDNCNWSSDGKCYLSDGIVHNWFLRELENPDIFNNYKKYYKTKKALSMPKFIFESVGADIKSKATLIKKANAKEKEITDKFMKFWKSK